MMRGNVKRVKINTGGVTGNLDVRQAVEMACIFEAMAPKAGNVTPQKAFHDTTFFHFVLSALAIGPVMAKGEKNSLGELVLKGVQETRKWVGVNTNLGIILMLAPLVKAFFMGKDLQTDLGKVLNTATLYDAQLVYRAIDLASPGGLGDAAEGDVKNSENPLSLLEAMEQASQWDNIAKEYVTNFDITFSMTLPALLEQQKYTNDMLRSITQTQLLTLAEVPDTLIARKVGKFKAEEVSRMARQVLKAGGVYSTQGMNAYEAFDHALRKDGNRLNPGTTADLLAAAIFVALIKGMWNF